MSRLDRQPVAHDGEPQLDAADAARARAAGAWVGQLARTLKTARLYDADNPTVVRFRVELAAGLTALLGEHGAVPLTFTPDDILCHGVSLHPSHSRDDNPALHFYRDGVRGLTFLPGMDAAELNLFLAVVGRVSSFQDVDEDLVTLLWAAELRHLELQYVATDADIESGEGDPAGAAASPLPWPQSTGAASQPDEAETVVDHEALGRSDDRLTADQAGSLETTYTHLAQRASGLADALRTRHEADAREDILEASIAVMTECLQLATSDTDRQELTTFLVRVLREAIALGAWDRAMRTLALVRAGVQAAPVEALFGELCHPDSLTTANAVKALDEQDAAGVHAFLGLIREVGAPAAEWLMHLVAGSRQQRVRRGLAKEIATLWAARPERLAPWLEHDHWYVVRNAVHILGLIGSDATLPMLRAAARHGEFRVRREAIEALAPLDPAQWRPILYAMLEGAETRTFCAALRQLATAPEPRLSGLLSTQLAAPEFAERPAEEQRALLSALAACGDEVLPVLSGELHRTGWGAKMADTHRHAVARCIARIGTPAALAVLAEGVRSRNTSVRTSCSDALGPPEAMAA